ncbi:MAG: MFS transporter [Clostridia bacterium]|nr:MFS transporter [Clostridia bacterium]
MKLAFGKGRASSLQWLYREAGLAPDVQRSLNFMMLGNLCGSLFGIICGASTASMVGLANDLHAGDFAYGLINGIPQAAMLLQIPFAMLVSRTQKRKRYILTYGLFARMLWVFFGMLPALSARAGSGAPLRALIVLLAISSCCSAAVNVCWFPWFSDLAPARIRGQWFSIRDTIIAACNLCFGIVVARMLDTLPANSRYVVVFIIGGILGMADMICFGFCKEVYSSQPVKMAASAIGNVLKDKPFMRLILMWTAWCFTANLCEPYLSRYSINEMGLNFTQMMIFGTAASSLMTIFVMRRWGRAVDRFGCRSVMLVATVGAALANAAYLFSTPGNVVPVMLRNALGAAFWCGSNLAATNMQLYASPDKTRPIYIAVFSCATALLGTALGSLTGGLLLEVWETAGWFTGAFDRYKAIIALATVLRLIVVATMVPPLSNDRDGTPQMLIHSMFSALTGRERT